MRNGKKVTVLLAALVLGLSAFAFAGCSSGSSSSSSGTQSNSSGGRESLDDENVDQNGWT